ncbi:HAD-IIB family hydrolase [Nitratireductor aquimarinus]|uniref:HAD-IIB family hydrolase n=1 Tax=Nitratireductor aquimarinus TaxID=889300 RepID=UPI001A8D9577|nr:HAD-IIB family hydrolase [Nitratireductor aquimarinus]MBN8243843.1 HAD-IIB family hydrolase [Nitratireductor aquimarinus]MBY6131377.1 HAD-IIB family hydrolase [Nitratireductor aquimarinus]MCA1300909.1 HAD-IIB family hydrolase [Nitratireductor aquimarinus]
MSARRSFIVFSDLDGTLLDHETYDFDAARPALARLRAEGHHLILASSKTAAEVAPIRQAAGFSDCPAIVENGAGILPPEHEAGDEPVASGHQRLMRTLDALPSELRRHFTGFSDWSAEEVAARTGLSMEAAARAKQRAFSEPGVWNGTEEGYADFCAALKENGVTVQKGGRFATLSFGGTKGARVDELVARYRTEDEALVSVALGDAPNDVAMLQSVDIGIVIPNPAHAGLAPFAPVEGGVIRWARLPGPEGWNEEILALLNAPE